ncbi:hypothetical protein [Halpernia frigidisoli]|uniref:Lipoprotein n=1 Tax=Halpernia frigidisoli TaxID=1125876 RepID=A0A1I3GS68_9FLAO|nr:hypothetical protein [Halpernia frigidisoli]SFI26162.1 hypothetical protein SAMN05443292_1990 [Halpernia frigidisoli]
MKKLILLIPFLLVACKKEVTDQVKANNSDTILAVDQTSTPLPKDSMTNQDSLIANSKVVEKVLDEGVNRDVDKNEIVRTADGSMLPFTIGDQFTTDSQKFILKLKNVSKSKLKITVDSEKPMNIRINQIKKPDGSLDGPYGKSLDLQTPQKGDYWIMLGKSLMADGTGKGHFSIKVE